ncbi:MAG: DUF4038 domain-containing protein [Shinella sp.]|nr:DUF4038 domain-containing protein [Shinella sp.]
MADLADILRGIFLLAGLTLATVSTAAEQAAFPLRISADGRHFVDASGEPFLMTGDTAWSLIGDLSREEAELYMTSRERLGFNTLLVSLIEHHFSRDPPRNFYGDEPFGAGRPFSQPNEAYFDHAEWFLTKAQEHGFLVLLTPAYIGVNCGEQGWCGEMKAAGPAVLKNYGAYLAKRFAGFPNVVWIHGGDFDPVEKPLIEAVVEGMKSAGSTALHGYHASRDTAVRTVWDDAAWLDFDTLYTYGDIKPPALERYRTAPPKPYILLEALYEGVTGANELQVRKAAYQALLAGAAGQVFGNDPMWRFSGPGLDGGQIRWQDVLDSRGALSMMHLSALFRTLEWWKLEPVGADLPASPVASAEADLSVAAARDGSLVLAYASGPKAVYLKSSPMPATARWFDPSSGAITTAHGKPDGAGFVEFPVPAGTNASGQGDWLLILSRDDPARADLPRPD